MAEAEGTEALTRSVLRLVLENPGCVDTTRGYYSVLFYDFIVELRPQYAQLDLELFAEAVQVPLDTIRVWLCRATHCEELTDKALDFVIDHPGCVDTTRGYYGEQFRDFVVELRGQHAEPDLVVFCDAVHVPVTMMREWLRAAGREESG